MTGTADSARTYLTRGYSRATFVYNIDIVGTCNLACPSCPVGNTPLGSAWRGTQPKGFMGVELFSRILDKICRESPATRPVIALYNWGEPLLHPDIGRIVSLVRERNLYCAVSTNLNQTRFLEDLVIAEPSSIKISVSGSSQATYGRTHRKGQIDAVMSNMRLLRQLVDAHGKRIDIFIGYHDYIGNDGDELAAMEAIARELRFGIRHKIARFSPLEKMLPLCGDEPSVGDADTALYDLLLVKPHEWSRVATDGGFDDTCLMREQEMTINFDGSVALCCNVFDYANNVASDFLSVGHAALQSAKEHHPFCGPCMAAGYPRSCGLDAHPEIQTIVDARRRSAETESGRCATLHL